MKMTLIHRRLWPALVRVADRFPPKALVAIREVHTTSGAHRVHEQTFPEWVPDDVLRVAAELSIDDAIAQLPALLVHDF